MHVLFKEFQRFHTRHNIMKIIIKTITSSENSYLKLCCYYPELKLIQSINAHPSNCICIKFDPTGKYFATGSADALVSLWDVDELVCVRCFSRLDWPVRTLSFSHDGKMLASASEDHFIDIAEVETGEKLWEVQCESPTFTVAWHPKRPLLAYACDDKEGKYDSNREAGTVKLFGLPNDS
uniref:THO complex 3 n=1 Tax=Astyanax mexicanus TaxID=7994 RepID=A0A8B9R5X8_ASTMX